MSTQSKEQNSPFDIVKWLLAIAVFASAVVGNVYFSELAEIASLPQSLILQVLAVVALVAVSVLLALSTTKGRSFVVLLKEANVERRKVVWPTRQETVQTTLIVVVVVFVAGLMLWAIDSLFGWLIRLLIG